MLMNLKTTLKGRVRAVRSHWRPCPVQVAQFQRHGNSTSDFADWLEQISAHGIGYLPAWSQVEARRELLLAKHGTGIDDDLSAHFFGPGAQLENVHVNTRGGQFLSSVVHRFHRPTVIEFGTAFGVSGMYLLSTISGGRLLTFDPCQDWRAGDRQFAGHRGNFERIPDAFENAFPPLADSLAPIHVAFVDGLHTYENVMREVSIVGAPHAGGRRHDLA